MRLFSNRRLFIDAHAGALPDKGAQILHEGFAVRRRQFGQTIQGFHSHVGVVVTASARQVLRKGQQISEEIQE
jgi:hypothetical protein